MNTEQTLKWIRDNLAPFINQAIVNTPYTEDWFAGITMRETGGLITKYVSQGGTLKTIAPLMRGDFTQRGGETEKQFHGFGFTQIDIASFPDFVKSGDWKDPLKCYLKTVRVLEGKRKYIVAHSKLTGEDLDRAITAAYNCGEGNVIKVITAGKDIDAYTTGHDYSKAVWGFRNTYKTL